MNAHAYLRNHPSPSQQEMEDQFGGNLCRCTGYRPILHAVRSFAHDYGSGADPIPPCARRSVHPAARAVGPSND